MARARATIDHQSIRSWVERRGGHPARVKGSAGPANPGILRIAYPQLGGERSLESITWDEFFRAFEEDQLAFFHQDEEDSRFSRFIARDSLDPEVPDDDRRGDVQEPGDDALELLEDQHREIEDLFAEIDESETEDKLQPFLQLATALAAHTKLEEVVFYPAVSTDETEEELRDAVEEHAMARRLLADLLELEPDDPRFDTKLAVLEELVLDHIEEEEEVLFEQVRGMAAAELAPLGAEMRRYYRDIVESNPTAEVIASTGAAERL